MSNLINLFIENLCINSANVSWAKIVFNDQAITNKVTWMSRLRLIIVVEDGSSM